jgi:protein-S-isoprenylcysteine O-methyltransferase Ste14
VRSVTGAVIGSLVWLVLAPGLVAGYIPWAISRWRVQPALLDTSLTRWLGVALIVLGLPVLLDAFARFALQGRGTPAPVLPPERLVVFGFYRFVRNPMYVAIVAIVVGQGLLLGDARLLVWAAALWLVFHVFVLLYEEPKLRRTYPGEYDAYRASVPRWIPRPSPWQRRAEGAE